MNRQIKFRVWVHEDNKMQYPLVFSAGKDGSFVPLVECADGNRAYKPYPIMQFTGLTDKNGKEIYDGDIVKCHYFYSALGRDFGVYEAENEITGIIEIKEMGVWLETANENAGYLLSIGGLHEESLEVIGNIYENPELLTKN